MNDKKDNYINAEDTKDISSFDEWLEFIQEKITINDENGKYQSILNQIKRAESAIIDHLFIMVNKITNTFLYTFGSWEYNISFENRDIIIFNDVLYMCISCDDLYNITCNLYFEIETNSYLASMCALSLYSLFGDNLIINEDVFHVVHSVDGLYTFIWGKDKINEYFKTANGYIKVNTTVVFTEEDAGHC